MITKEKFLVTFACVLFAVFSAANAQENAAEEAAAVPPPEEEHLPRAGRPIRPMRPNFSAQAEGTEANSAADPVQSGLKFENTPADIVLSNYAQVIGKTLLIAPDVPKAQITLRSTSQLGKEEYLEAIETVLTMHGISLVPSGEKFIRVFPAGQLRTRGVETNFEEPEGGKFLENGRMVSQIIPLKHISLDEAKKVIEGFKQKEGQIQLFERTNSLLITDTVENVNRMIEILKYVDQPLVNREETHVRTIVYAKANDIKAKLEEIIKDAMEEQKKQQTTRSEAVESRENGPPGMVRRPMMPGITRGGVRPPVAQNAAITPAANTILETLVDDAERGVIRGKVQIVADERTNILIILTRPENMIFFDQIIDVLDVQVETTPDVIVEVMRLEHAVAEDVAKMLNELIGNSTDKKAEELNAQSTRVGGNEGGRSESLGDSAERIRRRTEVSQQEPGGAEKKSKLGELNKEDVKILADERTNAIVIMAGKGDVETIKNIIKSMDIMLSQVMIETVIVQVSLSETLQTGIDWIQRAFLSSDSKGRPIAAWAGAGGGGQMQPTDTLSLTTPSSIPKAAGVTYYTTLFDLNIDAVLTASATDSNTRTLASPVILVQDNKEGVIEATTDQYFFKGKKYAGSNSDGVYYEDDVEMKSVGLTVTVTPRINAKGYVVMKIEESIESISGTQIINEAEWPIVSGRKLTAEAAVQSGQTVVLGGLVEETKKKSQSKIPLLGDIPLLGRLFRYQSESEDRSEILIFVTPYVLDSPGALHADALRRKISSGMGDIWKEGWSVSELAAPAQDEELRRMLNDLKAIESDKTPRLKDIFVPITNVVETVTTNFPAAK